MVFKKKIILFLEKEELLKLTIVHANDQQVLRNEFEGNTNEEQTTSDEFSRFSRIKNTCSTLLKNCGEKIADEVKHLRPTEATRSLFRAQVQDHSSSHNIQPEAGPSGLQNFSIHTDAGSDTVEDTVEDSCAVGETKERNQVMNHRKSLTRFVGHPTPILKQMGHSAQPLIIRRWSDSDRRTEQAHCIKIEKTEFLKNQGINRRGCDKCSSIQSEINYCITIMRDQIINAPECRKRELLNELFTLLEECIKPSNSKIENKLLKVETWEHSNQVSQYCDSRGEATNRLSSRHFEKNKRIDLCDIEALTDFDQLSVKVIVWFVFNTLNKHVKMYT